MSRNFATKIILTHRNLSSLINWVQCLQLAHNKFYCDNEIHNVQTTSVRKRGLDEIWEFVTQDPEKYPLSILTRVCSNQVNFREEKELFVKTNIISGIHDCQY